MRDRTWLEALRLELGRKRLPPEYIDRFLDEMGDHLQEFTEEQMSKDALVTQTVVEQIGSPREIAAAASSEFQRRRFWGRHPVLMFIVLPVIAMPLIWYLGILCVVGIVGVLRSYELGGWWSTEQLSPAVGGAFAMASVALVVLPAVLFAIGSFWLGKIGGLRRKWPLIACVIVGLIAGATQIVIRFSPEPRRSSVTIGMGFGSRTAVFQIAKAAAPIVIGGGILRLTQRRRRSAIAS